MQGQNNSVDSFREAVDIGQGSDSRSGGMNNQQTSLNSLIPPVERQWLSFVSPGEACLNASSSEVQNFAAISETSGSSSRNHGDDEGIKMEHGRTSSFGGHHAVGSMTKEILFPPRGIVSLGGHQIRNGASFSEGSSSNHVHQSMDLNEGYVGSSGNSEQDIGSSNLSPNLYLSSRLEREPASGVNLSSDIVRTSSGSSGCIMDGSDDSSESLGSWGLSCKRKALEGTPGQSCGGAGSSSSFLQPENCAWHNGSARYNPSSILRLSGSSSDSPTEPLNPRMGITSGTVSLDAFPSSSVNAGSNVRQVRNESNAVSQHESTPFNIASAGSGRRLSLRQAPFNDSLDLRSTPAAGTSSGTSQSQPQMTYVPGFSGRNRTIPWLGASSSRAVRTPNSFPFGDRGPEVREEASLRSIPGTNVELPMFVSASEMRNSAHDQGSSSLASGNTSTSLGIPSSTRIHSSSSSPLVPNFTWIPPHNSSTQTRQRTLEFAPWSLFPTIDSQTGGRSSHPDPLPPGISSSRDTPMLSGRNNHSRQQPYLRPAFLAERQGEDALNISNSLRVLSADAEGRRRLISEIRQVLHAMRRGENLQIEDYMLFDPFVYHGMAEMHDRHRDMRLDVDNMSYEELLALEERIGDVSTGLSEETIFKLMKHRKYQSFIAQSGPDSEPCCICQEEYADGDDVGALDCGHDFHTNCVKQWLMQKNLCPICKTTGLLT